jgi:uncharacterized membrane protein YdfJ with MMPL/SSD domain
VEGVVEVVERLDEEPAYRAAVTGERTADADEDAASLEDLKKGELLFGAPLALVVLLLVFGAVVAGLVPLVPPRCTSIATRSRFGRATATMT